MKLLIVTQKVNINDPILGFFHRWIIEFSKNYESIVVICLEKGIYDLPNNVRVLSLGKEDGVSKLKYVFRFYQYIWRERKNYDGVFVHMNQEYILLAGWWWRLLGKKVYLWRNHHAGSSLTDIASYFCTKIFCTSKFSYTAKYKKTALMPVGIDTAIFKKDDSIKKIPRSILFLGRISPVKKPHLLIEALKVLNEKKVSFVANFYGDALNIDKVYYQKLKQLVVNYGLGDLVKFYPGIPNLETVKIYNQHEIFVNLSSSGMYDKTIFEAMACGTITISSNKNLRDLIDDMYLVKEGDILMLADKLKSMLASFAENKEQKGKELRQVVTQDHSLEKLNEALKVEIRI